MALIDNLVAYWSMDEASGDAIDAHAANDLVENGGTIGATTGIISGARDFESGDTEAFQISDNADLSTGNIDFSFQAWVYAESIPSYPVVLRKGGTADDVEYVIYYDTATSRMKFGVASGITGANYTEVSANNFGALSTATWYCIHAWHDATNNQLGIAINAGTADTASYSSGCYDGSGLFEIGASQVQSLYWDGLIDEVGFWKRVLTSGERTDLYSSGAGLAYPFSGGGATVTPTTLALVLTTYAPTVSTPQTVTPTTAALTLTTFAPTISTPVVCTPPTLALVTTAYEPTVAVTTLVTPTTVALVLTTFAPTIVTPVTVTPATAALTLTTYAPAVSDGSGPYSNIRSIVSRFP